ncbi:MAG: ABC transporter substrate-binding protein [Gammaproteobacteria bacterium]|nr:ABC transporter substrate-binding protein [Gammaproteobacteria bacterium]
MWNRIGTIALGLLLAPIPFAVEAQTLIVAATKTPGGFDGDALKPNTQNVVTQVYEGLVAYEIVKGADGNDRANFDRIVGHLAESWQVGDGGKSYVFALRRGIKSPFGNELKADDVVWSWQKSLAQKRTGNFIAEVSGVTAVEKVADHEVKFTLKAPSGIFLHALTNYVPGIYDSTEAKKHATTDDPWALKWIDANTAGFGAYHLESVKQGEQAVFVANPNYFRGAPHYKRIVYREIPSAASRYQLLVANQVQWAEDLSHRQIAELQKDGRLKIVRAEGTSMAGVRMNPKMKPFDDVRVRRAIAYAADRSALNTAVFEGLASPAKSFLPPVIPGYDPSATGIDRDITKAKALLAEAGHANGIDITLEYSGIEWWEEGVAIQMQRALADAGIRVTPKRITDADMRARTAMNRRDIAFFPFRDFPFVLDPVYKLYLDAHQKGASNRNNYDNPQFDRLVESAQVEADAAKRLDLVRQANRLHGEDATWVYTVYPGHFEIMPKCMTGYVWYPDYHERWKDLVCK